MIKFLDLKKINDSFEPAITDAIKRVVDSGWYLLGAETSAFEKEYASYIGTQHAIGCANGLDALTLIIRAYKELGVFHDGDEIIVPANTYIASILAITENGLKAVLVEPDKDTLQIDPSLIEMAITSRTKAVMIVHLYGRCAYIDEIGKLTKRYNLKLIEDNAQAHGCEFEGRKTGALGDASGHSFYPGKNLGALGDGGMVTTDSKELADMVRTLANYGSSIKYVFDKCGRNSRLDEIQSAVLRVKLRSLDRDNDRRRNIAEKYVERISNPHISMAPGLHSVGKENVYHIFPILCKHRDKLAEYLKVKGIQTLIHYPIPPHHQQCYANTELLVMPESLIITESIHASELSLPISPVMEAEEVEYVINAVNSFDINI